MYLQWFTNTYKKNFQGGVWGEAELQDTTKPLQKSWHKILYNPMQLEEDLLFEPHGPKLKTHWMSLKDSAFRRFQISQAAMMDISMN